MVRKALMAVPLLVGLALDAAGAEPWTFQQVLDEASRSYPSVTARVAEREAASAEVATAKWQRYPSPSIETATDRHGSSNFLFRVQQVLWAGGAITGGIESAKSLRAAADKGVREAQFEVASRVIDAYVEAVRQQARRTVSEKNLKEHEILNDAIKRRVASEVSPQVDQRLSQARLSQAVNDLSSIGQALARSLHALSQLSGKGVTGAAPLEPAAFPLPESAEAALREAVAASPSLARLAFEEQSAEAQITVKKSAYWPTVALRYEKSFNNDAYLYGSSGDNRIMAVLEARPGAGLSALSGVASAVARRNALQEERRAVLRDLERLVSDAWSEMETAKSQLEYAASARTSAEDVAESYKRQYIIGRKAWLDVLNAVREATQSELYLVDARAQVAVASLRIALLTDRLKLGAK